MTTRQRVPTAIILVGSAFAAIGIALACGAIFVLRYRSGASTMLMVLVTFGWAILAMVGSMLLTLPGKVGSDRTRIDKGIVTVETGRDMRDRPTTIRGPGVTAEGEADITVTTYRPSIFLFAAALGLAALTAYLYVAGRATPVGAFVSLGIAFCMGNWARLARPPRGEA
jgi:hypothetical protein